MGFGMRRDKFDGGVDTGLDLGGSGHREGLWASGIEDLVELGSIGSLAVLLQVSAKAVELEGDLTIPGGIEISWEHGDTAIREPKGSFDPCELVEESRGQGNVFVAATDGRSVAHLESIGEFLPFLENLPNCYSDGVCGRESIGETIRDDDLVAIGGVGDNLDDFIVVLT